MCAHHLLYYSAFHYRRWILKKIILVHTNVIAICFQNCVQIWKGRGQKMVFCGRDIKYVKPTAFSYLTHNVCFSQEKIPSVFIRISQFCTNLVTMMVEEVLPYDGWPPPSSSASPEPSKVYELSFQVQNFKSRVLFQNDLWFLYNSRLNSLFASKAHVYQILSLKKFDWSPCLFTFFCGHCAYGNRRFSMY